VLVGVGRALALAEAAERAADDADVRDVDVAVDDERHGLARELGAQLVGRGLAHVLDRPRARLGEQRGQLVLGQRRPSRPAAIAPPARSAADRALRARPTAARDERPVLALTTSSTPWAIHVGVDVLRVDAQALGQRDAVLGQRLRT
jgi:hypothetical protein